MGRREELIAEAELWITGKRSHMNELKGFNTNAEIWALDEAHVLSLCALAALYEPEEDKPSHF